LYALVSLDIFLAAVFLCIRFFAAALSKAFTAFLNNSAALSLPLEIASFAFLTEVFKADFCIVFRKFLALDDLALFIADLIFGKLFTSCDLINIDYSTTKHFKLQGIYESLVFIIV